MVIKKFRIRLASPQKQPSFWDEYYFHSHIVIRFLKNSRRGVIAKEPWEENITIMEKDFIKKSADVYDLEY